MLVGQHFGAFRSHFVRVDGRTHAHAGSRLNRQDSDRGASERSRSCNRARIGKDTRPAAGIEAANGEDARQ